MFSLCPNVVVLRGGGPLSRRLRGGLQVLHPEFRKSSTGSVVITLSQSTNKNKHITTEPRTSDFPYPFFLVSSFFLRCRANSAVLGVASNPILTIPDRGTRRLKGGVRPLGSGFSFFFFDFFGGGFFLHIFDLLLIFLDFYIYFFIFCFFQRFLTFGQVNGKK